MRSRSATSDVADAQEGQVLEDLVAQGPGADDEELRLRQPLLVPPTDQSQAGEAVLIGRVFDGRVQAVPACDGLSWAIRRIGSVGAFHRETELQFVVGIRKTELLLFVLLTVYGMNGSFTAETTYGRP